MDHLAGVAELLHAAGVTAVDVAGVALDVCVTATCLDADLAGFSSVAVLEDAVAPTSEEGGQQAWQVLKEAGIQARTTAETMRELGWKA
jgi:nicotinamidase-related amidase